MQFSIRPVTPDDIPFLWDMIYLASRMPEDGATSSEAARNQPHVNIYVKEWGRPGDFGLIAYDPQSSRKLGAAWVRFLTEDKSYYGYYDEETPALAIAVLPEMKGKGVGSALLSQLIERLRTEVPGIVLTVRNDNPARHLYERMGFIAIDQVINRKGTNSTKMLLKFPDQSETVFADQNRHDA
jgi:ribosomal protein S18 acetylase RimI-like enzyme